MAPKLRGLCEACDDDDVASVCGLHAVSPKRTGAPALRRPPASGRLIEGKTGDAKVFTLRAIVVTFTSRVTEGDVGALRTSRSELLMVTGCLAGGGVWVSAE